LYIAFIYRFPYRPSTSEGEKSGSPAQAGDADVDQENPKSLVFRLYDDWGAGVSLLNFIAGNETETDMEKDHGPVSNETVKGEAVRDIAKDEDDLDDDLEEDISGSDRPEKTSSQPSERNSEEKKVKPHPYLVTR
jgi:hypothetical protein